MMLSMAGWPRCGGAVTDNINTTRAKEKRGRSEGGCVGAWAREQFGTEVGEVVTDRW